MIAFLFPGQGSQAVGMGRGFYDASPAARAIFDEANDALGFDLARLAFDGPEAELALTANTQPALLTVSVAAAAGAGGGGPAPGPGRRPRPRGRPGAGRAPAAALP